MTPDRVTLTITEADSGRSMAVATTRPRAEAIIREGLSYWPRYRFTIEPPISTEGPPPMPIPSISIPTGKIKAAASSALAFASDHKCEVVAVTALVASLPLPAPFSAIASTIAVVASGLAGTKYVLPGITS